MSAEGDLFAAPSIVPEQCECGGREFWIGHPPICKACKKAAWPKLVEPPEPVEQQALPGFPPDPVPHAPAAPVEAAQTTLELREALRRLRDYRQTAPDAVREAVDIILARLEPECPSEQAQRVDPVEEAQAPLFELGATAPPAAAVAEPIRVYVHFERAADVAEFGKRLGMTLGSSVRRLRYLRGHAEAVVSEDAAPQVTGERDKTFADVQTGLFGSEEWWEQYWKGMPTFVQRDLAPVYSIEMEFDSWDDVDHFEKAIDQSVPRGPKRTPSVWFPEAEIGRIAGRAWIDKSDPQWQKQEAA